MDRKGGWAFGVAALLAVIALTVLVNATPEPIPGTTPVGAFSGKFELVPLFDAGDRPVIRNGHTYYAERDDFSFTRPNGEVIRVFAGANTDGASIPSIVWWALPPDGPYFKAAAVHDAGYKSHGDFGFHGRVGRTRAAPYTRAEVDQILNEAMIALGVPTWKRLAIFGAVRAFGQVGWGS